MNRLFESAGMLMIGDAVLALVRPTEHCLLWSGGPRFWRDTVGWFAGHPNVTRGVAAAELGAGLWLAARQQPASNPTWGRAEEIDIRIEA